MFLVVANLAPEFVLSRFKRGHRYKVSDVNVISLCRVTGRLINGLLDAARDAGHDICGGHISGMFGFFFCKGPVNNFQDAKQSDTAKFAKFHRGMLERGHYFAPSQYEAGFTSLTHTEADVDATIAAAADLFKTL